SSKHFVNLNSPKNKRLNLSNSDRESTRRGSKLRQTTRLPSFSTQSTSQRRNYGGRLNRRSESATSKTFNVAFSTRTNLHYFSNLQ
ncbi:hypothetical protein Golob_009325, partial [Gossypium lobatum]|nr:hypothetical protein [Gossypium lobatum]